uniref:Regulator of chromosome condensation n=1 Tax=Palpitomonas bilix TaxID=652834 RepID=A0A7S3GJ78_9EUKA|mmetsp:Transcript_5959/g.14319  ORF Transcript_5959/g.14319 Transcript_5959/m.14319 type:complete len:503 (+) Transcript_5959:371-1879(+)
MRCYAFYLYVFALFSLYYQCNGWTKREGTFQQGAIYAFQGRRSRSIVGWGGNEQGQVGVSKGAAVTSRNVSVPTSLPPFGGGVLVEAIEAGAQHTIMLTSTGTVYSTGSNKYGQLGVCGPTKLTSFRAVPLNEVARPVSVAASLHGGGVVTETGSVVVWGRNDRGQLGLGTTSSLCQPSEVTLPAGCFATSLHLSESHGLVVCKDGAVTVWGENEYGELGVNDRFARVTPTLLSLPQEYVLNAAVGHFHTILLTAKGNVYTAGSNLRGQLCRPAVDLSTQFEVVELSTIVELSQSGFVTDVAAGLYHTVVLTDEGDVFSCGDNKRGQLGTGYRDMHPKSTPIRMDFRTPPSVSSPIVVAIRAVGYRTLLLTDRHELMYAGESFGYKPVTSSTQSIPALVYSVDRADASIVSVFAAGLSHAFVVQDEGTFVKCGVNRYGLAVCGDSVVDLPNDVHKWETAEVRWDDTKGRSLRQVQKKPEALHDPSTAPSGGYAGFKYIFALA